MSLIQVLEKAKIEYRFDSVESARKCLNALQKASDRDLFIPPEMGKKQALLDKNSRDFAIQSRSSPAYRGVDVLAFIIHELTKPGFNFSVVTRGSIKMSQQIVEATEILDGATRLFENSLAKFNKVSDESAKAAKRRVSQLNDYNSRLTESLNKLNKVLGDERMVAALSNAEKLVTALELLDKLEASGRLDKIMAAMNAK